MRDVVVVGAGPVGILTAALLTDAGLDVCLLERRHEPGESTRAIGVHAPVLAALEPSGITERLLGDAVRVERGEARADGELLGTVRFDRLSTRFPFVATLPQSATETALGSGAPEPLRGATVLSVLPRADRVRVRFGIEGRPDELEARVVIVAAGSRGRDLVFRPGALPAREYPDRYLMTDAAVGERSDDVVAVVHLDRGGVLESFPLPGGRRRFVAWDPPDADPDPAARARRLAVALERRGEREAAAATTEATAFGVRRVLSPSLRRGRVFAIGDVAHEVSPIGGQGMNLGLLDAATLAPLVATWLQTHRAPAWALRRWEARRVGSARTAARLAAVNTALGRPLADADAVRRAVVRLMLTPPADRLFARAYTMGLDAAG